MKNYIYLGDGNNPVTVFGRRCEYSNKLYIGIAVCGDRDNYNEERGIGIAENRSKIQPYAVVDACGEKTFKKYAMLIEDNISRQRQVSTKNLVVMRICDADEI